MKKLMFAFAMLFALPAAADDNFGVKLGQFSFDGDSSAATQVGLVYTWDFAGMLGVEGELNTSLSKGEVTPGVEYGITQAGAYGVLMTPGPFYFKGKVGYMYTDIDATGFDSSSDLAYGVGMGFELFGVACELEYTITDADGSDADFISFGVKF